jgi:hypothetical protein
MDGELQNLKVEDQIKKKRNIHHHFNSNNFSVSNIHNFASYSSTHTADPYKLPVNKIPPPPPLLPSLHLSVSVK